MQALGREIAATGTVLLRLSVTFAISEKLMLPPNPRVGYAGSMTNTLCIETSTAYCSLALAVGEDIFFQQRKLDRSHNEHILPMLTELFARAGLNKQDVQVIGFGAGPGSFTGVRIAASVTQGLALASASKVVAMKGSEILVRSAGEDNTLDGYTSGGEATNWLAVIPSRADAYYVSLYQQIDAELSVLVEDQLMLEASDWIEALAQDITAQGKNTLKIIGAMPDWMPGALTSAFVGTPVPDARVMISQVRQLYANGSAQGVEYALPIYVEGDSPWRKSS